MVNNVIDNILSDDILHAFVNFQYELCCEWIQGNPTSIRPPMLIVATAPSMPGKAGDLHAHVFDDGLGDAPRTLSLVGRSFGQRYLIVSAVVLTLQAMGVRIATRTEEIEETKETKEIEKAGDPQDLNEGVVVCALASDGRCIVKAATVERGDEDTITFIPSISPEGTADTAHSNVLTAFYEGYEEGLAEVREGQRRN